MTSRASLVVGCSVIAALLVSAGGRAAAPERVFQQRQTGSSPSERRLALVIGNDRYAGGTPLLNARRDAQAVGTELRGLGFQTTVLEDATRDRFNSALETLGSGLAGGEIVFFFFAGHGVEVKGENYLIPVDYTGSSEVGVTLQGISAGRIQKMLERARVSILVLDACRNNPYAGTRGGGGLASMEAQGSLIAFATGAGQTASDNPNGGQGRFTGALLQELEKPGLSIRTVFYNVRARVHDLSGGTQFPAVYDGLLGDVVLRPGPSAGGPTPSDTLPSSAPVPGATTPGRSTARGGASIPVPNPRATPNEPVAPPTSVRPPDWIVGDFRGVNRLTQASVELSIKPDGMITGLSGVGTGRATPVSYVWSGNNTMRDVTGAYAFEVEQTSLGFTTRQLGAATNVVEYRRMYDPPGTRNTDARTLDAQRVATPDELASMLAVINEWLKAWQAMDEAAGRLVYPSWDTSAVKAARQQEGVDKVVSAKISCNQATVRRDQAKLLCQAGAEYQYKKQYGASRSGQLMLGTRPRNQQKTFRWTILMFWNGSSWMIEGVS